MNLPSTTECFKIIDEMLREKNIITYKWLSRKLQVHNTIAKQLLQEYVEKENQKEKYIVTYLIFGKENGELVLILAKENDVSSLLEKNVNIVSRQIYSIQFSDFRFDSSMIYELDKETYEPNQVRFTSIKYPKEIIRKTNNLPVEPTVNNIVSSSTKIPESAKIINDERKQNTYNDKKNENQEQNKKAESNKKVNTVKPVNKSKGSISSFFQKQQEKAANKKPVSSENSNSITINTELKENETKEKENPAENDTVAKLKEAASKITEKQLDKTDEKPKKSVSKLTEKLPENTFKKSKSKKTQSRKKSDKNKKKLKRIIFQSDSSSSGEASEEDSRYSEPEDIPELKFESPTKDEESAPTILVHGRKRKRKVVEKTEMTSDGFLSTRKEIVYESCSSDENENTENDENFDVNKRLKIEVLLNSNSNSKTKININEENIKSLNTKSKQSSIMNFFKKP